LFLIVFLGKGRNQCFFPRGTQAPKEKEKKQKMGKGKKGIGGTHVPQKWFEGKSFYLNTPPPPGGGGKKGGKKPNWQNKKGGEKPIFFGVVFKGGNQKNRGRGIWGGDKRFFSWPQLKKNDWL